MPEKTHSEEAPYILRVQDRKAVLILQQPLSIYSAERYRQILRPESRLRDLDTLTVDFSQVHRYDSYLAIFVGEIRRACEAGNIRWKFIGMPESMEQFLAALHAEEDFGQEEIEEIAPFRRTVLHVGNFARRLGTDTRSFVDFLGQLVQKLSMLLLRPRSMRWTDFPFLFMAAAVNALPIVLLIGFLIGLIIGYQGAVQLKQFGADIYLADLIGISITRELGPIMTAIIVAGRSGSAFAAEIGTMKVSEEVDALQSLGFDIIRFLVMPRVIAVMLAMPFLTLFADVAGILGGLVTGLATLDLTMTAYFNQMQEALTYSHVFSGVFKSIVFGFLIATLGCFRGLQVHGGAESVGRYTTRAVVSGIFLIIFTDAIFAFIFQVLDI